MKLNQRAMTQQRSRPGNGSTGRFHNAGINTGGKGTSRTVLADHLSKK